MIPAWLKAEHLYGILWLTTPKTHAAHRFVPISTSLWQRLWARVKRLDIGPRELIFTNSRGNPVRSSTERHNWNKALKPPASRRSPSQRTPLDRQHDRPGPTCPTMPGPPSWATPASA